MICRIWRGWTAPNDAEAYEKLLRETIVPGIERRRIKGFREIQLMRRPAGGRVEFATIMWFDTLDAVRDFAGSDHETAIVPPAARDLLSHYDQTSVHYDVFDQRKQPRP